MNSARCILLRTRYALSGTEVGFATTRRMKAARAKRALLRTTPLPRWAANSHPTLQPLFDNNMYHECRCHPAVLRNHVQYRPVLTIRGPTLIPQA
eukprot:2217223-Rhodomonas_salina.4